MTTPTITQSQRDLFFKTYEVIKSLRLGFYITNRDLFSSLEISLVKRNEPTMPSSYFTGMCFLLSNNIPIQELNTDIIKQWYKNNEDNLFGLKFAFEYTCKDLTYISCSVMEAIHDLMSIESIRRAVFKSSVTLTESASDLRFVDMKLLINGKSYDIGIIREVKKPFKYALTIENFMVLSNWKTTEEMNSFLDFFITKQ